MSNVKPGIYLRGQIDYAKIEAINYSTLKHMARSPKHYKHVLENGTQETPSMGRGTVSHIATLEPERFIKEYTVWDGGRRAGKAWEAFEAAADAAGRKIIKADELDVAFAIRDAVRSDAAAANCFVNGHAEVTLVWVDDETGLLCKGRVDFLRNDNVASDLKITQDIEHAFFSRTFARMQYHVQAAFYSDGIEALTKKPADYKIVAVESKPPHDVVVYPIREDVTGPGRDAYRDMLRRVAECRESGRWPGYANGVEMPLTLPPWMLGDQEDDLSALGLE